MRLLQEFIVSHITIQTGQKVPHGRYPPMGNFNACVTEALENTRGGTQFLPHSPGALRSTFWVSFISHSDATLRGFGYGYVKCYISAMKPAFHSEGCPKVSY